MTNKIIFNVRKEYSVGPLKTVPKYLQLKLALQKFPIFLKNCQDKRIDKSLRAASALCQNSRFEKKNYVQK